MSKSRFGILIAFFVLMISGVLSAQDTTGINSDQNTDYNNYQQDPMMQEQTDLTEEAVNNLRTRLNLREDQVEDISDVVDRYHRESITIQSSPQITDTEVMRNADTELRNRYNAEIETLLDENQRVQFRQYSEEWWNSVNSSQTDEGTEINRDYKEDDTDSQDSYDVDKNNDTQMDGTDAQDEGTSSDTKTEDIR